MYFISYLVQYPIILKCTYPVFVHCQFLLAGHSCQDSPAAKATLLLE